MIFFYITFFFIFYANSSLAPSISSLHSSLKNYKNRFFGDKVTNDNVCAGMCICVTIVLKMDIMQEVILHHVNFENGRTYLYCVGKENSYFFYFRISRIYKMEIWKVTLIFYLVQRNFTIHGKHSGNKSKW